MKDGDDGGLVCADAARKATMTQMLVEHFASLTKFRDGYRVGRDLHLGLRMHGRESLHSIFQLVGGESALFKHCSLAWRCLGNVDHPVTDELLLHLLVGEAGVRRLGTASNEKDSDRQDGDCFIHLFNHNFLLSGSVDPGENPRKADFFSFIPVNSRAKAESAAQNTPKPELPARISGSPLPPAYKPHGNPLPGAVQRLCRVRGVRMSFGAGPIVERPTGCKGAESHIDRSTLGHGALEREG